MELVNSDYDLGKMVYVIWEYENPSRQMETTGFLVNETEENITIATSISDNNEVLGSMLTIDKELIIEMEVEGFEE